MSLSGHLLKLTIMLVRSMGNFVGELCPEN